MDTLLRFIVASVLYAAAASPVQLHAAESIARASIVRGSVSAASIDAPLRALEAGSELFTGDRVVTGRDSAVQITFDDRTRLALGENTELIVSRYSMARDNPAFALRVLRGVFRIVTGVIAGIQPRAVAVEIPVATIGIRGTHFGAEIQESSAVVILLDPENGKGNAIEVTNQFGSVTIDQPGYGTEIPDAASPPSPPRRMRVRAIDNLIRTLSTIQRMQIPRAPR